MKNSDNYYITTPIYYVNDIPHIGHAYTTLACDVIARFKRLDGYNVKFLTGTDEHGQKVEKSAINAGINPQEFTDNVSQNFRDLTKQMNFSNDDFIRTTENRHKVACKNLWAKLIESGDIYLGSYSGWYSVRDEAFYTENEILEKNGQKIGPTGADVEWVEEPSYFFKLSAWQNKLLKFYDDNPDFILPITRRNEVISFVGGGLEDLSISRTSFNWGVNVPGDNKHIMYVWLDALTNYLTAIDYPNQDTKEFKMFWPADLHIVGKDILRFHAVYWPAFLMSAGLKTPKKIFAHGWWTNEGEKISKSLGNVIDPVALKNTYGLDQVRYFLLREVPFGKDGDFSRTAMVRRVNSELSNDYGNLVQRVMSMVNKNCGSCIPKPHKLEDDDEVLLMGLDKLLPEVRSFIDSQALSQALDRIWLEIRSANSYIDKQAPWTLKKENFNRMETVLYVLTEVIRNIAIITQPFMPNSAEKILDQVGISDSSRSFKSFGSSEQIIPGSSLPEPFGVFPRILDSNID
ncbi:MAG: methionine--tRNA ligase [Rhodospirillaceae bacterium]|nr:methionine--tRNA ligase [Rhodospirillaceae bacterium]OUT79927.1 MAG: methionine--tRNA ligase [Rhodospirillaceae bacterium TMED23]|tara:strand:- start:56174 stop:57724 length:1551 start_codon:yes stop_codon:yes gene_type:complete